MQEFKHIMFYEEDHKYLNLKTKDRYTSVTQSIGLVKPDVDWDYWAVYKYLQELGEVKHWYAKRMIKFNDQWYHKKHFMKEAAIKRKEWNDKADVAKVKGTFIHLYLENLFNNKVISVPDEYKKCVGGARKFFKDHRHLNAVFAEQIVGDDEYMIAGQVDRLFATDGKLAIYDYKTDAEIKTENKWSNLKEPFDFLPDCDLSKYTIQVNMYRWIIERNTDWDVEYMKVVHLKNNDYDLIDIPRLDVEPLANEVRRTHKQPETCD